MTEYNSQVPNTITADKELPNHQDPAPINKSRKRKQDKDQNQDQDHDQDQQGQQSPSSPRKKSKSNNENSINNSRRSKPKKKVAPDPQGPIEYPRLDISNEYNAFFNDELYELLDGPQKLDLYGSYVSIENTLHIPKARAITKILGTFWSGREKEMFFIYLGRYGISQIDQIKKHLPKKSILDIMTYYDILYNSCEFYKKKKKLFMKLVRYDEIPQAMEMDETAIMIEESLVDAMIDKEFETLQKDEKTQKSEREKFIDQDDDDQLINMSVLDSMCKFFNMDHLTKSITNRKNEEPRILYGYEMIKDIIYNLIKNMVTDLIKKALYATTDHRVFVRGMNWDGKNKQDMKLGLDITLNETIFTMKKYLTNRPILLYPYIQEIDDRLDFVIEFDQKESFKEQEKETREFSSKKAELRKSTFKIESAIRSQNKLKLKRENLLKQEQIDDDEDEMDQQREIEGQGNFIIDDEESDQLLDNKTALKLFYQEAFYIDMLDKERSKEYQQNLLSQWGHGKTYKDLIERDHDKYTYDYYNNLLKSIKGYYSIYKSETESDFTIEEILDELDESDLSTIDGRDLEITEEMILLYSLTFERYKK